MPTTELTPEQEQELLESLRKKGYKALGGQERELYKTLNAKYPLGEKTEEEDENEESKDSEPEEKAEEETENPFAKNPRKKVSVVGGQVDLKASYKFKDNVLSGSNYFKKDQVISGGSKFAQQFFNEGLLTKV